MTPRDVLELPRLPINAPRSARKARRAHNAAIGHCERRTAPRCEQRPYDIVLAAMLGGVGRFHVDTLAHLLDDVRLGYVDLGRLDPRAFAAWLDSVDTID